MTAAVAIDAALRDPALLGAGFGKLATWETWITILKAAFGGTLNRTERRAFDAVAGSRKPPARKVRELWCIIGRRGGKSRIAAAVAAYIATCVDHRGKLAPGETGTILVLAASQAQAQAVFGYIVGFLEGSPVLRQQIQATTATEIRLAGGIVIAVHSNSFRTIRGRTLLACIFDEAAFWRDDSSANPDVETYRAVLPSLASTSGMLVGISSPYRRVGLIYQKHRDYYGKDDADVLVVAGPTTAFNPTINREIIEAARRDDPTAAASEWDGEFRSDLSQCFADELIDAAVDHGRPMELPPRSDLPADGGLVGFGESSQTALGYRVFVDASAGRHDAFTIGIAHREDVRIVADVIRGRRPPFDPASVAAEYAALAKEYHCSTVVGDAYAGEWVAAAFRDAGVEYRRSDLVKSALYLECLPQFSRGALSIPNHTALIRELRLLERRTARSGRDSVDHGPGGSDDFANVLAGSVWLAAKRPIQDDMAQFCGPIQVGAWDEDYSNDGFARPRPGGIRPGSSW